jgi:hypothetical protein
MTLVVIWRESKVEGLWVVSDSRLSQPGAVGCVRLTDRAAKILEIPVILRRQTPGDVLGTPVKIMNLGFAFAGSSLVALQAYAAVLPLWSRLQISGPEILPSVKDFAEHLAHFVECFASEVAFPKVLPYRAANVRSSAGVRQQASLMVILLKYDHPSRQLSLTSSKSLARTRFKCWEAPGTRRPKNL